MLLRESFRQGARVGKRTLANLSRLSAAQIATIRAALRGEAWQPVAHAFEITASRAHGHIEAVTTAMQRVGVDGLLASRPSRERDLVCAMVAARHLRDGGLGSTTCRRATSKAAAVPWPGAATVATGRHGTLQAR